MSAAVGLFPITYPIECKATPIRCVLRLGLGFESYKRTLAEEEGLNNSLVGD